jgi:tetratricopeptide (TPR) repeat protein
MRIQTLGLIFAVTGLACGSSEQPPPDPSRPSAAPATQPQPASPAGEQAAKPDAEADTPAPKIEPPDKDASPPVDEWTIRATTPDPELAEQYKKAGWTHYRAGEFEAAAKHFALEAGVDPGHKPAHNLACAAARAGRSEAALLALAESIRRGGDQARELARKDEDLASLRAQPGFEAALEPADVQPEDSQAEPPPPECPEKYTRADNGSCYLDVEGRFQFAPVAFTKALELDVQAPARPSSGRWTFATIYGTDEYAEALGLTISRMLLEATKWPELLRTGKATPFEWIKDDGSARPFFWWPGDDPEPILVIPLRIEVNQHKDSMQVPGIYALALARHESDGWKAFVVPGWEQTHWHIPPSMFVHSMLGLRIDELELFSLVQKESPSDEEAIPQDRQLCRIKWIDGQLNYACTSGWSEVYSSQHK